MNVEIVDVHSHLVPGVDDGARDADEALTALDRLVEAGASRILTTPHVDASTVLREDLFAREQAGVETAWSAVAERFAGRAPQVSLYLGREVMLDTPAPVFDDRRVCLNGGRYILVEFPRLNIPPGSEDALYRIVSMGLVPVVAHVERYHYHGARDRILGEWRDTGAAFQVNAPSLVGAYGNAAEAVAWELLSRGWADLAASDFHARGGTWIPEARAALAERGGGEQERLLLAENPRRIVQDQPLREVPGLPLPPAAGRWSRLRNAFRRSS